MKYKVYVTRIIPEAGLDLLRNNCDVEMNLEDRVLSKQELIEGIKGKDGLLCLLTDLIDKEVLNEAAGLKGIANSAVGYDNIDIFEATRLGIPVSNTPDVLTDATADMTWALLFTAARRIVEGDKFMRSGNWRGWGPMQFIGADITGRTLGIIGAGRIGTAVAQRSKGFSMKVLYTDKNPSTIIEKSVNGQKVELNTLLRNSDFVSLHVSLLPTTRHLIGERELQMMQPHAILVNTSRGPVVDEEALVKALKEKKIAGAGLDVYEDEPWPKPGLVELSNVVVCPHIASATNATRNRMATMAATNLMAMLRGEEPPNLINLVQ